MPSKISIYKVTWYDAQTELSVSRPTKPYKKYLAIKETSALEIYKDKDCVVLITERTDNEVDRTIIPRKWIKKIEKI